jgi:hypothetical protein
MSKPITMADVADRAMAEMRKVSRFCMSEGYSPDDAETVARAWFQGFVAVQQARLTAKEGCSHG